MVTVGSFLTPCNAMVHVRPLDEVDLLLASLDQVNLVIVAVDEVDFVQ